MTLIKRSLRKCSCQLATGIGLSPARRPVVPWFRDKRHPGQVAAVMGWEEVTRRALGCCDPFGGTLVGSRVLPGVPAAAAEPGWSVARGSQPWPPASGASRGAQGPVHSSLQLMEAPSAKPGSHFGGDRGGTGSSTDGCAMPTGVSPARGSLCGARAGGATPSPRYLSPPRSPSLARRVSSGRKV